MFSGLHKKWVNYYKVCIHESFKEDKQIPLVLILANFEFILEKYDTFLVICYVQGRVFSYGNL